MFGEYHPLLVLVILKTPNRNNFPWMNNQQKRDRHVHRTRHLLVQQKVSSQQNLFKLSWTVAQCALPQDGLPFVIVESEQEDT